MMKQGIPLVGLASASAPMEAEFTFMSNPQDDASPPPIIIEYGIPGNYVIVTKRAFRRFFSKGFINIPKYNDQCDAIFGDHLYGTLKHVKVTHNGRMETFEGRDCVVDVRDISPHFFQTNNKDLDWFKREYRFSPPCNLTTIHENLLFEGGNVHEEYAEQIMAICYLKPHYKVLEIGSNIGRNTLVIATILGSNMKNFVTMECDPATCNQLSANLAINNYNVSIEPSALSYRRLMQKGWDTIPFDETKFREGGYTLVNTITYPQLTQKYGIQFDTLVADCEGALYYILMDDPSILDGFHTIIMENDYHVWEQKQFVDSLISSKGFKRVYVKGGGWGPCKDFFFEVWQRL